MDIPNLSPAVCLLVATVVPKGLAQDQVDFAREVLPILSNKCFVCHGPDPKKKDLVRLDSYAGATRDLGGYQAIDPDAPEKSAVLARIHDAEDPMPPKKSDKSLTDAERGILTRWIKEGGRYAKHWAFVPPRKQPPPAGPAGNNPIDAFVFDGLRQRGIGFAPAADRASLARRAALVLTGLPPEPAQLGAFLADDTAGAYARLVDTLLASPRFGEHQARYWLDAVRYGDTHGLHLDNRRGIYPYRDWVVRAFNANLPLDDFITWQLAGDLLPDPTLEQRIATGYVRMNPTTSEGGVIPAEFQAKNNFDRTETLGTVMLGMTMTCARCHTHKYDPIEQREYYRLLAFFNSTAESPLDGNRYDYAPVARVPRDQAAWDGWSAMQHEVDALLRTNGPQTETAAAPLVAHARACAGWKATSWQISKPVARTATTPAKLNKTRQLPGVQRRLTVGAGQAVWVAFDLDVPRAQVLWLTCSGSAGTRVLVGDNVSELQPGPHGSIHPLALSAGRHQVRIQVVGATARTPVEVRLRSPWQALAKAGSWIACSREDRLLILADRHSPVTGDASALTLASRAALAQRNFTTTLVAKERTTPRRTRVLQRGEYNLPTGDPLQPDTPAVMGAMPKDAPRNRLGLARWLTNRDHPLVARVLLNRIWQRTFGHGLVRTPEDFGRQGEQPTHPALLDWLAVELQDRGWDLKHMLKLMLTSRTFRQGSAWRSDVDDPENRLFARGPRHRLDAEVIRDMGLWASGLLDPNMGGEGVKPYQPSGMWAALAHPASNTKRYVRDRGRKLYRRGLYVYWKRTSPHPMMTLFDAPSREASCVRRSRTDTSLQSLGLLNETQRLEMARTLAQRLLRDRDTDRQRLDQLFGLLACRPATARERDACTTLLSAMRGRYADAAADAKALLASGDAPRATDLDPREHAAWAQVVITVLASDVALLLY